MTEAECRGHDVVSASGCYNREDHNIVPNGTHTILGYISPHLLPAVASCGVIDNLAPAGATTYDET